MTNAQNMIETIHLVRRLRGACRDADTGERLRAGEFAYITVEEIEKVALVIERQSARVGLLEDFRLDVNMACFAAGVFVSTFLLFSTGKL